MTDRIGIKITELLQPVVSLNLSEAEADSYPYAVYYYTPVVQYTKDGPYKISANVTVEIYATDFDEAYDIMGTVRALISEGMTGEFSAVLSSEDCSCSEGIWLLSLNYMVNQYNAI